MADVLLSPHFRKSEFERSARASALNLDNSLDGLALEATRALCVNVLEPLRVDIGISCEITSGYRSPALNAKTPGSSKSSQHSLGEAADIRFGRMAAREVCERIVALGLPFDQLIFEWSEDKRGVRTYWVHVSHRVGRNRRQVLTGTRRHGKQAVYTQGIDGVPAVVTRKAT